MSKEQTLQSIRLGLLASLMPDRYLHKTAELTPDNYARLGISQSRILARPEHITLTSPALCRFLEQQIAVAHSDCGFWTEEATVWAIDNARMNPATGAVVAGDGSLLIDSIKNHGRLRRVTAYGHRFPTSRSLPGTISTITGSHIGNHFHWLIEALPRLHSLEQFGEPVTLIMPDNLSPLQRSTLEMCLPANVTALFVSPDEWLQAERFILPSYLTRQWDFAYLPAAHLRATRERILGAYDLPADHVGRRRLYISRARANIRRVINETDVISALAPHDFEVVYLEELSFADQVRAMHDAAVVVAQHGAGLANLLFAGRIPIVELTTPVATPVYFFQALAQGQDYRYVFPTEMADHEIRSMDDAKRYSAARDRDITVPIDALQGVLNELTM